MLGGEKDGGGAPDPLIVEGPWLAVGFFYTKLWIQQLLLAIMVRTELKAKCFFSNYYENF